MKRLKEVRQDRGITQKEISKLLNISLNSYSRYERGKRTPDIHILKKITEILNISSDYLLEISDIPLTIQEVNFNNDLDHLKSIELLKKYDLVVNDKEIDPEIALKIIDLIHLLK